MEISKNVVPGLKQNLLVVGVYINDITSTYYDSNVFEELSNDISNLCDHDTPLIITEDVNSRIAEEDDNYNETPFQEGCYIETSNSASPIPRRSNCDLILNSHGKKILELCHTFNLSVLNGRLSGDPRGLYTFHDPNLGASTVDYSICSQSFFKHIKNFMVLPQNELSDHSKIVTELNYEITATLPTRDKYDWIENNNNYKWVENKSEEFKNYLDQLHGDIDEIKQRLEAGLVDSSGKMLQDLFIKAADNILEKKKIPKKGVNGSKKWFDGDCNSLKKGTRKIGREKRNDPSNVFLREKYHEKLKLYKRTCNNKRYEYWQNKFDCIESALNDPKIFWNT